jgi:hypothetical protein
MVNKYYPCSECQWCDRCRDGLESLQNYLLSAYPAASWDEDNVQQVQKVVCSGYYLMVQTIPEKFGILVCSCYAMLRKDLKMHHFTSTS